tara:strand:+ start:1110 stop:1325 length:216 start_codon:yes stop_codon:yes gene_type:complete
MMPSINDVGGMFNRVQEVLNEWCEMNKEDHEWFPSNWALEKLWMDVEILKAAVYVILNSSSSNHDEDPESL